MRSLAFRLAAFSALWLALGLGAAGWFVSDTMAGSVEATFAARLSSLLDAAVAGAAIDEDGAPVMLRPPSLPEFERPFSGAYWQLAGADGRIVTSRSLWDERLPADAPPGESVSLRRAAGPRGAILGLAERRVVPAGSASALSVSVALDRAGVEEEIAHLRRVIALLFSALGAGLAAALVLQLVAGLSPLRRARRSLARVRAGEQERLGLDAPSEIAPLVAEIDALIVENAATVERARAHLGNLAHALRTPLAVLRNALDRAEPDIATARAEATRLDHLVRHHLARARATATRGAAKTPLVPLRPEIEAVADALRRLYAGRALGLTVTGEEALRVRVDRTDLAELAGNLVENACKWARSRVAVTLARGQGRSVTVTVEDDGPGLSDTEAEAATRRGVRLDEATPGAGLGLAIVSDLAALHGGGLSLGRSALGGLRAQLTLPGA